MRKFDRLKSILSGLKVLTPESILKGYGLTLASFPKCPKNAVLKENPFATRASGLRVMKNVLPDVGFSWTSFSACIGLIFGLRTELEREAMFLALLASGFSGNMTEQSPNTCLYNLDKWSRESVQSGRKDYAPDFKSLSYYQSEDFKRPLAYLDKLYTFALDKLSEMDSDRASRTAEKLS